MHCVKFIVPSSINCNLISVLLYNALGINKNNTYHEHNVSDEPRCILISRMDQNFQKKQTCVLAWWTRKLSCLKDDRAMRHIYGCPEKFREYLTTPTATFPENLNGLLFRFILWMCVQNWNSWDNGGIQKLGSPWICPHSLFCKIFDGLLFGWTLWIYPFVR